MVLVRLVWRLDIIRRLLVRPVLVLGGEGEVAAFRLRLQGRRGRNFDAVTMAADQVSLPALRHRRIWGVVVTSTLDGTAADATLDCKMLGLPVLTSEEFHETYLGRVDLDALTADRFLAGDRHSRGRVSAGVKRLCDIVIGSLMLVLALPAMVSAAVAIKLDSPGPVFYRQERVGRFGKTFTIFKFRSMTVNAEACGKPRWAQKEDPRVTRVGRFIRASRIDELPQLANIIRGDMSLVGPRPERPHFVEQLARAIPFYHQRAYVKPGLTGWAQVNYPYGASIEDAREKLAYDLFYVKHRTVWLDLVTLLSTVRVVLFRDGAR
jgi:exopolysaccharide biosynthesis polyprenyl glycosylphosphotransferase